MEGRSITEGRKWSQTLRENLILSCPLLGGAGHIAFHPSFYHTLKQQIFK